MSYIAFTAFLIYIAGFCFNFLFANEFSEVVEITHLPNYNVLTDLKFKISQRFDSGSTRDTGTFPELIYSLPERFGLREGRLTFTRGLWDSQRWSKAPFDTASSGFQFNSQFDTFHGSQSLEDRYNQAISAISGYFCSSLKSLNYSNSIKPTCPTFNSKLTNAEMTALIGIIPSEPICNENLQPFFDLLPCSNRAGIAQMIKPESIYQSDFHSIQLEFHLDTGSDMLHLSIEIVTVYNLNRWDSHRSWSLTSLLGAPFLKECPFSKVDPKVIVKIPKKPEFLNCLLHTKNQITAENDVLSLVFEGEDLFAEIGASDIPKLDAPLEAPLPFKAFRYKSGINDDVGGFGLVLENNEQADSLEITVVESIPTLFRVFLHEMQFSINGTILKPDQVPKYLKEFSIIPSLVKNQPLLIQSRWLIPSKTRVQIYLPFEREFLHIEEFPRNSERGIELPGALIFYRKNQQLIASETTNTLLFPWPIPDGTMPFNVITMTSTLIALFYGSFFNLIFRRYYLKHADDPPPGVIPKAIWKLKRFIKSSAMKKLKKY